MTVYINVFVMLIGFLVWFASSASPKPWAELGRIMFFCGLLTFLLVGGETIVKVLSK